MNSKERFLGGVRQTVFLAEKVIGREGYKREKRRSGKRGKAVGFGVMQAVAPIWYETSYPNRQENDEVNDAEFKDRTVELIANFSLAASAPIVATEIGLKAVVIFAAAKGFYNLCANSSYSPTKR